MTSDWPKCSFRRYVRTWVDLVQKAWNPFSNPNFSILPTLACQISHVPSKETHQVYLHYGYYVKLKLSRANRPMGGNQTIWDNGQCLCWDTKDQFSISTIRSCDQRYQSSKGWYFAEHSWLWMGVPWDCGRFQDRWEREPIHQGIGRFRQRLFQCWKSLNVPIPGTAISQSSQGFPELTARLAGSQKAAWSTRPSHSPAKQLCACWWVTNKALR